MANPLTECFLSILECGKGLNETTPQCGEDSVLFITVPRRLNNALNVCLMNFMKENDIKYRGLLEESDTLKEIRLRYSLE